MTAAEHEARIDLLLAAVLAAQSPKVAETTCAAFLQAIHERNAARTPEQVAAIEQERGLRK